MKKIIKIRGEINDIKIKTMHALDQKRMRQYVKSYHTERGQGEGMKHSRASWNGARREEPPVQRYRGNQMKAIPPTQMESGVHA